MDLLISRGDYSSVWLVEKDKRATRLEFTKFDERDLSPSVYDLRRMHFPVEVIESILLYAFYDYLKNWNFDLCIELLMFSKSFTRCVYREIYGQSKAKFFRLYSRLCRTLQLLENLYEQYLSQPAMIKYSCAKLTSIRRKGYNHQPWDFLHSIVITPIVGMIVDLTETQLQFNYGKCYGESIWVSGQYKNELFKAKDMKTPVINLMMVDIFDTLIHNGSNLNDNFMCFFKLVKKAFGLQTGVFVMVRDEKDLNPFITRSDLFLEL